MRKALTAVLTVLLGDNGILESLRRRGYEVAAPI